MTASFLQGTIWSVASKLADAQRKTLKLQLVNIFLVTINLLVLSVLWVSNILSIYWVFLSIIIEWTIACIIVSRFYDYNINGDETWKSAFLLFLKSLLPICIPLIPYTFFTFIKEFGDRWILQTWGGENEQAYFGVSERFTMLVMICTSSILRVIWKEFAESNYKEDSERVFLLFKKSTRSTYFFVV